MSSFYQDSTRVNLVQFLLNKSSNSVFYTDQRCVNKKAIFIAPIGMNGFEYLSKNDEEIEEVNGLMILWTPSKQRDLTARSM